MIAVTGMSSYLTRHTFAQMWVWQATHKDAAQLHPARQVPGAPRRGACGLRRARRVEGRHHRRRAALQVRSGRDALPGCRRCPSCLTAPQVEAARKIYAGPKNPRTGEEIYSPLYPGSELGWGQLAGGDQPLGIPIEFFKYYVLRDPVVGLQDAADQLRRRCDGVEPSRDPAGERSRSRPGPVLRARRKAAAGGRVERHGRAAQGGDQLLQRGGEEAGREDRQRVDAILHGPWHGPWAGHHRRRKLQLRRARPDRAVEGSRARRRTNSSFLTSRTASRSASAWCANTRKSPCIKEAAIRRPLQATLAGSCRGQFPGAPARAGLFRPETGRWGWQRSCDR